MDDRSKNFWNIMNLIWQVIFLTIGTHIFGWSVLIGASIVYGCGFVHALFFGLD